MRVFALTVGYGTLIVAPSTLREGLVSARTRVGVPDFRGGALWGDDA